MYIRTEITLFITMCSLMQIRPSDLDRYKLPEQCRLPLTEHDRKTGEELLKVKDDDAGADFVLQCSHDCAPLQEPFILRHPEWVKELQHMLKVGEKAEIQVRNYAV